MALPGMGPTNMDAMKGLRAAGGERLTRRRERTFVDQEMGQLHLVGGSRRGPELGAWACMTHCPYEAPEPVKRMVEEAPRPPPTPPSYDVAAENQRRAKALQAREQWENSQPTWQPKDEKLSSTRLQKRIPRESPFATELTSHTPTKPRGTRRLQGPESVSEHELASRRGRKKVESCRAASSAFGLGGSVVPEIGADITCAAAANQDAYAIGNPRAESFVLRNRPTKRVGIQHQREDKADWAHRPSAVKMVERAPDCIGFGGGGDGGLSAVLAPEKQGRKVIERAPPDQDDRTRGVRRQGFERDAADTGVFGDAAPVLHGTVPVQDVPKPDVAEKLRHFGAWYCQQYGEPPSREALEHAAAQLAAEAAEAPPSLQAQIQSYQAQPAAPQPYAATREPPVDPRAQHFVEWYEAEYGEAPPQELVDRAATNFAVSGERADAAAPEPIVLSGGDPIRPHVARPLAFAPPEPAPVRPAPVRPRGQRSTINLGWD